MKRVVRTAGGAVIGASRGRSVLLYVRTFVRPHVKLLPASHGGLHLTSVRLKTAKKRKEQAPSQSFEMI